MSGSPNYLNVRGIVTNGFFNFDEIVFAFKLRYQPSDIYYLIGNGNLIQMSGTMRENEHYYILNWENKRIPVVEEHQTNFNSILHRDIATSLWEYLQVEKGFVVNER